MRVFFFERLEDRFAKTLILIFPEKNMRERKKKFRVGRQETEIFILALNGHICNSQSLNLKPSILPIRGEDIRE